jgi:small redox-active disulfide protein 2
VIARVLGWANGAHGQAIDVEMIGGNMEIKVLGIGCPKCKRLEELAREAAAEAGVEAAITHVTNMDQIMAYDVLSTPGLVIDEQLKCSGRLPRKEEIVAWIRALA